MVVILAKVCNAVSATLEDHAIKVCPEHKLVDDLGFDSLRMASLSIALEEEFDEALLLNDWIAEAGNPRELNVASLAAYIEHVLSGSP